MCTNISEQYNMNIIYDSGNPCVSHDRLQRLLVFERKWNTYIQKHYSCLLKLRNILQHKTKLCAYGFVLPGSKTLEGDSQISLAVDC